MQAPRFRALMNLMMQTSKPRRSRATQSFEPCDPIGRIIELEMARRRGTRPPGRPKESGGVPKSWLTKTRLMEDSVAAHVGQHFPAELREFKLLREAELQREAVYE